jgi:hypothetical protein
MFVLGDGEGQNDIEIRFSGQITTAGGANYQNGFTGRAGLRADGQCAMTHRAYLQRFVSRNWYAKRERLGQHAFMRSTFNLRVLLHGNQLLRAADEMVVLLMMVDR